MRTLLLSLGILCALAVPVGTYADDAPTPPHSFMSRKRPLPELIVHDKRENFYFTLLPAIGADPETGFNFGLITELFQNKTKEDPFFNYTPYRKKLTLAAIGSTSLWQNYMLMYDEPYVLDTPFRIRGFLQFLWNPIQTYFGLGSDSMQDLHFPGSGSVFKDYGDYKDALKQESSGTAYNKYNEYEQFRLIFSPVVEYDLLGGILRPLGGLQFGHFWVDDPTGDTVSAKDSVGNDIDAVQAPTKLAGDCASGAAIGCNGGFDNFFKIGLTLDTRDFEPDPSTGVLVQSTVEFATKALGSDFAYQRVNFSAAGYQNLLFWRDSESAEGILKRLVLAGRFLYTMQFGDVPFFSVPTLAYNADRNWEGLGGFRSLRGFTSNRFVGKAAALTNWELRWWFAEANPFNQNLRFMLAPFWESGRVFDDVEGTTLSGWEHVGGVGFRLAWNLATVILFDYGVSRETSSFYMEIGYTF